MQYRKLGSSDLEVSALAFGCWQLGDPAYWGEDAEADAQATIDVALDAGINLFDTADSYGDGESERALRNRLRDEREAAGEADPADERSVVYTAMERKLVESQPTGDRELRALAKARAAAVKGELVRGNAVGNERGRGPCFRIAGILGNGKGPGWRWLENVLVRKIALPNAGEIGRRFARLRVCRRRKGGESQSIQSIQRAHG